MRRFISWAELRGMTDKDLSDAALNGSTSHKGYWRLLQRLRAARAEAQRRAA